MRDGNRNIERITKFEFYALDAYEWIKKYMTVFEQRAENYLSCSPTGLRHMWSSRTGMIQRVKPTRTGLRGLGSMYPSYQRRCIILQTDTFYQISKSLQNALILSRINSLS